MQYVKLFGERNTGTTWIENLLRANLATKLVRVTAAKVRETFVARGSAGFEEDMDAFFVSRRGVNFGWKHRAVTPADLAETPKFGETGFVFLTKDPYWFVRSLHRNPYNRLADRARKAPLDDFAVRPWPLLMRDELGPGTLANPFELWNRKVRSYLDTCDQLPPGKAVWLRYEDALVDDEREIRRIAATLGLAGPETFTPWETSTKGDAEKDRAHYQRKYLASDYHAHFSREALTVASQTLAPDLMARLGYTFALIPEAPAIET